MVVRWAHEERQLLAVHTDEDGYKVGTQRPSTQAALLGPAGQARGRQVFRMARYAWHSG